MEFEVIRAEILQRDSAVVYKHIEDGNPAVIYFDKKWKLTTEETGYNYDQKNRKWTRNGTNRTNLFDKYDYSYTPSGESNSLPLEKKLTWDPNDKAIQDGDKEKGFCSVAHTGALFKHKDNDACIFHDQTLLRGKGLWQLNVKGHLYGGKDENDFTGKSGLRELMMWKPDTFTQCVTPGQHRHYDVKVMASKTHDNQSTLESDALCRDLLAITALDSMMDAMDAFRNIVGQDI